MKKNRPTKPTNLRFIVIVIIATITLVALPYLYFRIQDKPITSESQKFSDEIISFTYPANWKLKVIPELESKRINVVSSSSKYSLNIVYDLTEPDCVITEEMINNTITGALPCEPFFKGYKTKDQINVLSTIEDVEIARFNRLISPNDEMYSNTTRQVLIGCKLLNIETQQDQFGEGVIDYGCEVGKIKNLKISYEFTDEQKIEDLANSSEIKELDRIIGSLVIKK